MRIYFVAVEPIVNVLQLYYGDDDDYSIRFFFQTSYSTIELKKIVWLSCHLWPITAYNDDYWTILINVSILFHSIHVYSNLKRKWVSEWDRRGRLCLIIIIVIIFIVEWQVCNEKIIINSTHTHTQTHIDCLTEKKQSVKSLIELSIGWYTRVSIGLSTRLFACVHVFNWRQCSFFF